MHKIKAMLMEELYEIEDELARSGGLSPEDVEYVHMLTDTIKNICKIGMLEDGGYSEEGGSSYARGRGRNAKRDSMGRYSRDGGGGSSSNGGSSYGGSSYRRGGYSRDDGKEHMVEKMQELMEEAGSEEERRAIQQCIQKLENS